MIGAFLQPYVPPTFDWRDLKNLSRHFPMMGAAGMPNWVLGGGVGVAALIEADQVEGYVPRDVSLEGREHKDLDVYVFEPLAARLMLEHPHEIYCARNFRRPIRCVYHDHDSCMQGFCFELLQGYYFGFPPPERRDVVAVRREGETLWSLSPEYIIASRCFSHAPLREQEDAGDVGSLRRRLPVKEARLASIVRRSHMGHLSANAITELSCAPYREQKFHDAIAPELVRRHSERVLELPSEIWRALLMFGRTELNVEAILSFFNEEMSARRAMDRCHAVGIALMREAYGPFESTERHREIIETCWQRRSAVHLMPQLLFLVRAFLRSARRVGWRFEGMESFICREFLATDYMHVFLAKLEWTVQSLEKCPKGERYLGMGILQQFFSFLRQSNWQKMAVR